MICNSVSSSVKTNGWLTAFITLERGLRQGSALSVPLYVLTAETMAINIRQNLRIHGIRPPDSQKELKLSQYADDTTSLLSDDQSIDEVFSTFICINVLLKRRSIMENVRDSGAEHLHIEMNNSVTLIGLMILSLTKSSDNSLAT